MSTKAKTPSCCSGPDDHGHEHKSGPDFIFVASAGILLIANLIYLLGYKPEWLAMFSAASIEMAETMWLGVILGLFFVGLMSKVPREYFQILMGRGNSINGLMRAVVAGILLDLCSHGILLIAAKLYERGVSLPQVMAFLIASPWNSFSLTIILMSLIGWQWTLIFIAGSCLVAFATGYIYMILINKGVLPSNPHSVDVASSFSLASDTKTRLANFRPSFKFFKDIFMSALHDGQMLVRWLLLGIVIASAIQAFVPADIMSEWLGPTLLGLFVTLVAATIIEVCSEGSVPIASVIFHKAAAPGNAFTFLMAGVSTDYTEMLILRQTTKSWKIALSLPFVTVPQILLLGYIMNMF